MVSLPRQLLLHLRLTDTLHKLPNMVRPPAQTPPKSHLTLGLEIKFYAAIKSSTFNRTMPNECIVTLLGERLRRVRLSGPEGYGSMFKVVLASKDLSDEDRLVDYSRWNLTTDATARPQNPAWFRDCEYAQITDCIPFSPTFDRRHIS